MAAVLLSGCADVAVARHGTTPDAPVPSDLSVAGAAATPFVAGPVPAASVVAHLSLQPLDGGTPVALAGLRGARATVVAFVASYCAPCATEVGDLQRRAALLAPRGVSVLIVDEAEDAATARAFLAAHGVRVAAWLDGGGAHDGLGLLGVPTTAVLGPDGSVVARLEGAADNAGLGDQLAAMGIPAQ